MRSDIYWIDAPGLGRLAVAARPRGGDWLEGEIAAWAADGVSAVVSLLEPHETRELTLEREHELLSSIGIDFVSFPIADRGLPHSLEAASALIETIRAWLRADHSALIHCRAGIGRSALIAACVLSSQGVAPEAAFERIAAARGVRVPDTNEQKLWVDAFGAAYRVTKDV